MKKLITVLLASMLGILSVESALAEELSSGNETDVILDETATPESVSEILAEEASPQIEASAINDTYEIPQITPEDVLSAGDTEETVLESGGETPVSGETYSGTWGTCNWDINSEGVLTIHAGTGVPNPQGVWVSVWSDYREIIFSVVAEKGVCFPQDSSFLFDSLDCCESIDLSQVDTSSVTDMSYMFGNCGVLKNLDLSNFDTSNVKAMNDMFYGCESLISLDLCSFDTSNVTNMSYLFCRCESLTSLNVSNFDTSNVTEMTAMFSDCNSLISLNLSSFDTTYVKSIGLMFSGCESLISLDLSNFDTSNVTYDRRNMGPNYWGTIDMFDGCINLSQLKTGSKFCFRGDGGCPSYYSDLPNLPSLPDRFWRSESTGNIYTTNELTGTRNNIADTYYAYNFPHPRLVAAYNGVEGIGLKFQKVENAKKYLLYRKYNGTWSHICTFKPDDPSLQIDGNKIMYTDISVAKNYGKGYIYSVSAIVGDLETTYDTKGAAIYRLTPPTLTAAANSSAGTATITWKGVFGKTETNGTYDLQYAEYKDGKAGTFKSMTALPGYNNQTLSATVKGLKKGSRYVFRIRCAKTNKDRGTYYSEYSPWLSVTIKH